MLIKRQLIFLSLFLGLMLGVPTFMFGALKRVGGRQRSASSLEVADFDNYWLKDPERMQDLERLTQKFNAEKRRLEEERKRLEEEREEAEYAEIRRIGMLKAEDEARQKAERKARRRIERAEKREREAKLEAERVQERKELDQRKMAASHLLCSAIESRDALAAQGPLEFLTKHEEININSSLFDWKQFDMKYKRKEVSKYFDDLLVLDSDFGGKYSLLHSAVHKKDLKFIEFLCGLGANSNLSFQYHDEKSGHPLGWAYLFGPSPLGIAKGKNDQEMVDVLTQFEQKRVEKEEEGKQDTAINEVPEEELELFSC